MIHSRLLVHAFAAIGLLSALTLVRAAEKRGAPKPDPATEAAFDSVFGLVEALRSAPSPEGGRAGFALQRIHEFLVPELLALAEKSEDPWRREWAILLLAKYAPLDSLDFFVREVDLKVPSLVVSGDVRYDQHPCFASLVAIGEPSINPILRRLGRVVPEGASDKAIELYAEVFCQVYGRLPDDRAEALEIMQRARERLHEDRRQNIDRLIARYREITEPFQ